MSLSNLDLPQSLCDVDPVLYLELVTRTDTAGPQLFTRKAKTMDQCQTNVRPSTAAKTKIVTSKVHCRASHTVRLRA
jgi:hypothetical protein